MTPTEHAFLLMCSLYAVGSLVKKYGRLAIDYVVTKWEDFQDEDQT